MVQVPVVPVPAPVPAVSLLRVHQHHQRNKEYNKHGGHAHIRLNVLDDGAFEPAASLDPPQPIVLFCRMRGPLGETMSSEAEQQAPCVCVCVRVWGGEGWGEGGRGRMIGHVTGQSHFFDSCRYRLLRSINYTRYYTGVFSTASCGNLPLLSLSLSFAPLCCNCCKA